MAIFLDQSAVGGSGGRLVAPGMLVMFAGGGAPSGYLVCDGSSVPVATYPALFAQIGYFYGGAGANFNLPDDQGLVWAGAGLGTAVPGLTNHTLGLAGGSETHTLLTAELATHTHLQNAHTHTQDSHNHTQNSHAHGISTGFANANSTNNLSSTGTRNTTNSTDSATATNIATTATNQNTTATNQNTTATNQATTAVNVATVATNQNTTATNQNTTAVNQNEGSSTPFNIIQPTRYYTPCIAF